MFQISSGLSPLYAYLIYQLTWLKGKQWTFLVFQSSLVLLCMYILFAYPMGFERTPRFTLMYYPLFILLSSIVFYIRFGNEYNRVIALSIVVGFLQTELHEIPAFIQEYVNIGIVNWWPNPLHPINHIFTITVFILGLYLAKSKLNFKHLALFALTLFATWVIYFYNPRLDIAPHLFFNYIKRWMWFYATIAIYYTGYKK